MGKGNLYSSYSRKARNPLVQHILKRRKEPEMGNHVIEGLSYMAPRPKKTQLHPLSPLPLTHKMSSSSLKQMMDQYGFCGVLFIYLFWPHLAACRILVSQPGIEFMRPALGVQSLNHWTSREITWWTNINRDIKSHLQIQRYEDSNPWSINWIWPTDVFGFTSEKLFPLNLNYLPIWKDWNNSLARLPIHLLLSNKIWWRVHIPPQVEGQSSLVASSLSWMS